MAILAYLFLSLLAFGIAIQVYGKSLARRMGEDDARPTPAVVVNDGRDFVPTKRYVLFAHHFSAIAGAGPILGPTAALLYGFMPAWLWVVFGGIFIGAVHDFMSLFICMREGGHSMAEVAKKTLGKSGFLLFILFTILMLLLVTSSFLSAVSMSLTSLWPLDKLGLTPAQTLLKTVVGPDGVIMGRIGGIASTSVVIITLCSPLLGWLIYKKNVGGAIAYPLAVAICLGSIVIGVVQPIVLNSTTWTILISIYVFFAAGIPVWVILQPRDFINVQILYAGIVLLVAALLVAGVMGMPLSAPSSNIAEGTASLGLMWPMMFIMIACGAISGFHSLVSGGTTTKQLATERDARKIGFNAMLLESLLAVCVLLSVSVGLSFEDYKHIMYPIGTGVKSNPILAFSLSVGHLSHQTLHIPVDLGTVFGILLVEGFVITTLDAAVRLNRYLFEELWNMLFTNPPTLFKNYLFNSFLAVALMWVLAYSNAFTMLWPIFGAANQLLAAMGLITVTVWLMLKGKKYFFAIAPALFMLATTLTSLVILLLQYIKKSNYLLAGTAVLLFALSLGVIYLVVKRIFFGLKEPKETGSAA
jgi:carbon starvation protein